MAARGWQVPVILALTWSVHTLAATPEPLPTCTEFADGKARQAGFFDVLTDRDTGSVHLVVPADTEQFLLQLSLPRGIGSNDIGLDRGQLGDTQLVSLHRVGRKALLTAENTGYRASSSNADERQAVTEAFASSVLWGLPVVAAGDGCYVVDYTDFLLADSYGVAARLEETEQGDFSVDASRSAPYPPRTRSFPDNTELEATVTFTGSDPGEHLVSVTPDPRAITVHVHHSLVRLPAPGFEPRPFHPQSGYFPVSHVDYAAPIDADIVQRRIPRHRLTATRPIVYYLDPGVPEPIRSALLDGARWWRDAFAAAGYPDGFRVALLPEGADPMDIRYNVIQWVHRSTRGWSYGASVVDPRTGEILKGKVTLGSLRVRQDLLIAQGLLAPYTAGRDVEDASAALEDMALARIRQLSAHEVGHTLGLAHNYSASRENRASVMDYPHPLLRLDGDAVDLGDAYATGIGAWDKHAIRYGYAEHSGPPEAFLRDHLAAAEDRGLTFITDQDARPPGSAHPDAHLWDSGTDIVAELSNTLAVRKVALANLGADALPPGTPYSELADVLVPIFYLHRYQTEAVVKLLGGVRYGYAVKASRTGEPEVQPVPASVQRQALETVLRTLETDTLRTPDELLLHMPPKPPGYERDRENAPSRILPLYDPVTAAEAAAEETLRLLMIPERLARLRQQHARHRDLPGAAELFDALASRFVRRQLGEGPDAEIDRRISLLVVEHLLMTAYGPGQAPEVTAEARAVVAELQDWLGGRKTPVQRYLAGLIDRARKSGEFKRRDDVAKLPPGSPI